MMSLQCIAQKLCELEKRLSREDVLASAPSSNFLRVASSVAEGETVTIDSLVFEVDTDGSITAGRIAVVPVSASVRATGTLTSNATNVTDGDTVTIGTTVYRFKDTMAAAYDVKRGATAADSLVNLKAAINLTGTVGTTYFAGTLIHPTVTAGANRTTLVVTAKAIGTAGNAIATTETAVTLGFGNTTLTGGTNVTAAEFTTALTASINSNGPQGVTATRTDANSVIVADVNERLLVTTETLAGANNAWATATFVAGTSPSADGAVVQARVPSAQEVTVQVMVFPFNFAPSAANVTVRTSAGVYRAWDGAITSSGNNVIVASSGSTNVAAADIVTVTAQ